MSAKTTASPNPFPFPADVRAYALSTMGWSEAVLNKVEAEFYLYQTMRWSSATWEEIRDALTEVLNEVAV